MDSDLSGDFYRSLFNYSIDGVLLTAPDGKILAANPAACEMLGRTEEELCKAGRSEVVDVSDTRLATMLEERARTGHIRAELTFIHANGTRFPAEISSVIFKDRMGSSRTAMIIRDVTEHKKAEEALRKSKHQYDLMASRIPVGIYILRTMPNESFALEYVSPRMAEMLNLSIECLLENAESVFQTIHPEDRQGFIDLNLDGIRLIRPFDWTGRFPAAGNVKWLHFLSSPELQEDGTILWFGIVTDVTERMQMEETLKGREIELSTIIESEPECVKQLAADCTLLHMNRAGLNLIEAESLEQVQGQNVLPLVMPEYRDAFKALTESVFAGQTGSLIFEIQGLKGSRRWLETHAAPLRNGRGQIISLLGITRDITERKQAEQTIFEAQQVFRTLIENTPDIIARYDRDCRRTYVNPTYLKVAQIPEQDLLAAAPIQRSPLPAASAEVLQNLLRKVLDGGVSEAINVIWPKADNIDYWYNIYAFPEFDREGRVVSVMTVSRDITALKQGELALERANRALRTLSACNEALVRAGSESGLLDDICRLIVETGGYRMAWVGFPEQDMEKTVRPVAQCGYKEGYLAEAKISWADTESGRGPTGTAIRSGAIQLNQNTLTNPAMAPWRDAALKRGYQSSIALPLKGSAGTLGTLTLYASEPDAFNETEVTLLKELADDLTFGIETLRIRVERDRIAYEQQHHEEILRHSLEQSIQAIADTVEARDSYTAGHQRHVAELAVAIAREMGLAEEMIHGIRLAASIHDLGKIQVPAEILSKPGKLSEIELRLIKVHPQSGYEILKDIEFPWPIADIVRQHHEKLDGSGYPQGLKDGEILPESRILAVADVIEAMSSHRPYRAALGIDLALQEIERGRGGVYDPVATDACLKLFREERFAFQ